MFSWLHPYAKPETLYRLCGKLLPWFTIPGLLLLVLSTVWGLLYAPADYQMGDSYRIIFIHVPSAMLSMGIYFGMAVSAFIGTVWQQKNADLSVAAMAPVGAVMTFIALFTGAFWGKPMWGTWWVWDARLTSELILLFLYLGVIALFSAYQDKRAGARAAAILAMVGVINLPIIHFSVEWWNTLHQGATITKFDKPSMDARMLWPMLLSIVAYSLICGAIILIRMRNELIEKDAHRPWVLALAEEKR